MVVKARVSYMYAGTLLLEKNTKDFNLSGSVLSVTLSREDTVKFPDSAMVEVQLEVELYNGQCLKSPVYKFYSSKLLNSEALL